MLNLTHEYRKDGEDSQKPTVNCVECDKNIPVQNNDTINYCKDCDGNLCNNCNNNHNNKYPNHIKNNVKVVNPEEENKDIPPQCKLCNDNLDSNKPVQHCSTCNGDLCDKCGDNHNRTKPNHKSFLIEYLKPYNVDKICNKCGTDLKDDYKNCDKCNIPLCNDCGDEHKQRYPNHKLKINRKKPIEKEEEEIIGSPEEYPKINCAVCDKNIPAKNNSNINYCNDCDGNLCNNCDNNHNNKYPSHRKNKVKVIKMKPEEENTPVLKCDQCNDTLDDKKPIEHCPQCKEDLCDKCGDNHSRKKPNHKPFLIEYLKPINDLNCNECGTELGDNYKNCDKCNIPLCDKCVDDHKEKNPNHKIVSMEKFYFWFLNKRIKYAYYYFLKFLFLKINF